MHDIQISLATIHDVEELFPLLRAYQEFYEIQHIDAAKTRQFFQSLIESASEGFILIARVENRLTGFATGYITRSGYFAERLVHMGDLFVIPESRRKGIGRGLIQAVSRHAEALGMKKIRWLTSPTNATAHRLYDSLGGVSSELRLYVLSSEK